MIRRLVFVLTLGIRVSPLLVRSLKSPSLEVFFFPSLRFSEVFPWEEPVYLAGHFSPSRSANLKISLSPVVFLLSAGSFIWRSLFPFLLGAVLWRPFAAQAGSAPLPFLKVLSPAGREPHLPTRDSAYAVWFREERF